MHIHQQTVKPICCPDKVSTKEVAPGLRPMRKVGGLQGQTTPLSQSFETKNNQMKSGLRCLKSLPSHHRRAPFPPIDHFTPSQESHPLESQSQILKKSTDFLSPIPAITCSQFFSSHRNQRFVLPGGPCYFLVEKAKARFEFITRASFFISISVKRNQPYDDP